MQATPSHPSLEGFSQIDFQISINLIGGRELQLRSGCLFVIFCHWWTEHSQYEFLSLVILTRIDMKRKLIFSSGKDDPKGRVPQISLTHYQLRIIITDKIGVPPLDDLELEMIELQTRRSWIILMVSSLNCFKPHVLKLLCVDDL